MNLFNDDSNFIYLLNIMGQKIKVNDVEQQALISSFKDKIIDFKKIKIIVPINTGDIIQYQNSNWLIISEVSHINSIYKATVRKTQHTLRFHVKNNKIFETPGIVDIQGQSIDEGRIISLLDGKIQLLIKDTSEHRKLGVLNRFIMMGIAWEVEAITRELTGLIHIFAKKTQFNTLDNKENEIAYNEAVNGDVSLTPTTPTTPITAYIFGGDILLDARKIYQVYDSDNKPIIGKSFVFTLEKSDKNINVEVNSLVTNLSVINLISIEITASSVRGYFNLVAKCNEDPNIILRKEIRVKGIFD